ncbi:MAG: AI-2E family transporter, partial [Aliarcobacter cryaerophilus]
YMVINISISNILEPKLMGKELGLSPLVIFFSLIFWGYILGIVGMFLAVPITMTLKIAFDSNSNSRWLGILMSDLSRKKLKKRV